MTRLINWAILVLYVTALAASAAEKSSEFVKGKICIGTNGRMSVPSNREHHYRNFRDRYTNCTYVDGNLELTWVQDENLDLSFLQYIREVTGYVLISHVDVRRIVLPRLQIIRGRTLFKLNVHDQEFALMITLSKMNNLEMPALRDILGGSVGLFNNYNLCHMKTINWDEIITGQGAKYVYVYNFTFPERECPACDSSCEKGCWGEGPQNCQRFSKISCSPQCWQGRCFGPNPRECCHLFCAGGCTGPKQSDCLACRNFYDDGVCKQECPAMKLYNPTSYSWETNPNGKYAYGATCVRNCPEHLLKDNGACVRSCPPDKKATKGECVPCDGPCPKTCVGVVSVHAGNIENFRDCTIIEGSLSILDQSFKGFQQVYNNFSFGQRYPKMHPDRLEVFSTLKEVTGYVNIQGYHEDFTNLSYFRNLEFIGGRALTEYFASLYIVKTSLKSLGLSSLQKIHSGTIAILENKDLCFVQGINWKKIKKSKEHEILLQNNKPEANCTAENLLCDPECSTEGCWGPGPNQCLSCAHFQFGNRCLPNCDTMSGMYKASPTLCKPCHEECESTCSGPGPDKCTRCKHVRDGPFCAPFCHVSKYNRSGECESCHENCVDGCTGPGNTIGPDGCGSCEKAIINGDITVDNRDDRNYYRDYMRCQDQGEHEYVEVTQQKKKCLQREDVAFGSFLFAQHTRKNISIEMSQQSLWDACIELVTVNGHPFSLMDDSGFKLIMRPIVAQLKGQQAINAASISEGVFDKACKIRELISSKVQGKLISLKVESMTRLDHSVMGIHVQLISDGYIHVYTLALFEVLDTHTTECLIKGILDVAETYSITADQIYAITTASGASMLSDLGYYQDNIENNTLVDLLKEGTELNVPDAVDIHPVKMRGVRCTTFTLRLVVQDFLKSTAVSNIISKARKVSENLFDPNLTAIIKSACYKNTGDCALAWHSTLDMILRLIELRAFGKDMWAIESALHISNADWVVLESLSQVLQVIKETTKVLRSEQLTMGDFYKEWLRCQLKITKLKTRFSKLFLSHMRNGEKVLFENDLFVSAIFLDPRFQMRLNREQRNCAIKYISTTWARLKTHGSVGSGGSARPLASTSGTNAIGMQENAMASEDAELAIMLAREDPGEEDSQSTMSALLMLFENYPRLPLDRDILEFWEDQKLFMPELYSVSQVVLAAPATEVSVEVLLSGLEYVLSPARTNLPAEILGDVLLLRANRM